MTQPDPAPVLDLIEAFRRSKTMFAAVKLGVFDKLEESPADAATLAHQLSANTGALERLLDACVGLSLLSKQGGVYANQPVAAAYLARRSPHAMTGYIQYSNEVLDRMWGRGGQPYRQVEAALVTSVIGRPFM